MAKYLDNSGLARVWDKVKSHVSGQPFVRYDSQSLSDAYKLQARTNIDAAKSDAHTNPNLLDNAYFVGGGSQLGDGIFPINQRGQTSYTTYQVTIDRWTLFGGSVVLAADGITVTSSPDFGQVFEPSRLPVGTYTASVKTADGKIGSITFTTTGSQFFANGAMGDTGVTLNFIDLWAPDKTLFSLQCQGVKIAAAKLEKGTVSTLANDPVPDFGEELRKCQRYLFIRDYAQNDIIANGLTNNLTMFLPASMRSGGSPTMTFTTTPYVIGNGVISTPSSVNLVSVNGNQAQIYAPTTESHSAQTIVLYAGSATRMTISNEL